MQQINLFLSQILSCLYNTIHKVFIDNKDIEGNGQGLSDQDISNHALIFLAAGSETTSNTMGFFFIRMLKEKGYLEILLKELDSVSVIKGMLSIRHVQ